MTLGSLNRRVMTFGLLLIDNLGSFARSWPLGQFFQSKVTQVVTRKNDQQSESAWVTGHFDPRVTRGGGGKKKPWLFDQVQNWWSSSRRGTFFFVHFFFANPIPSSARIKWINLKCEIQIHLKRKKLPLKIENRNFKLCTRKLKIKQSQVKDQAISTKCKSTWEEGFFSRN